MILMRPPPVPAIADLIPLGVTGACGIGTIPLRAEAGRVEQRRRKMLGRGESRSALLGRLGGRGLCRGRASETVDHVESLTEAKFFAIFRLN